MLLLIKRLCLDHWVFHACPVLNISNRYEPLLSSNSRVGIGMKLSIVSFQERRPKDLKERMYFARDRSAELIKRRRLLQQCKEIEDEIVFATVDSAPTVDDTYFEKVDQAYEIAKSFE